MQKIGLNFEIKRKLFHLMSLVFPIIYLFIPRLSMSICLLIITAITIYLDISKHYDSRIKELIEKIFGKLLRPQEQNAEVLLTGASYMALGFLVTAIFFEKGLTICSWLVLIASDCAAAIVGIKIGTPLKNGKSYAGTVAFVTSAILVSIMSYFIINYHTSFSIIMLSSIAATAAEFYSKELHLDDNFLIPVTFCLSTVILGFIL